MVGVVHANGKTPNSEQRKASQQNVPEFCLRQCFEQPSVAVGWLQEVVDAKFEIRLLRFYLLHLFLLMTCHPMLSLDQISDVDGALVRTFLSPAHRRAATQVTHPTRRYRPSVESALSRQSVSYLGVLTAWHSIGALSVQIGVFEEVGIGM